jgi:hypothetical protein
MEETMKKFFALFTALFVGSAAFATAPSSQVPTTSQVYQWNRFMGPVAFSTELGTKLQQMHRTAVGTLDFSLVGGAVGDLAVGITLPIKAIVRRVFFDVVTPPTSGGSATIAFKVQSAGDLKAALAIASWTGIVAGIPDGTTATMIKATAERQVYATVATAALTAGKIKVFVDYVVSE